MLRYLSFTILPYRGKVSFVKESFSSNKVRNFTDSHQILGLPRPRLIVEGIGCFATVLIRTLVIKCKLNKIVGWVERSATQHSRYLIKLQVPSVLVGFL